MNKASVVPSIGAPLDFGADDGVMGCVLQPILCGYRETVFVFA